MPSFYNGKRFFLTYPQCDSLPHELVIFLHSKGTLKYYIVAREKHADGNFHLHACVEFDTIQRKSVEWLDFEGKHPNKQDPRKWAACVQYCKKEGDFMEGPAEAHLLHASPMEVCEGMENQADWFEYCIEKKIGFQYATWFWNRAHPPASTILTHQHEGVIVERLQELHFDPAIHRTLILRGPSGCGKTTWAKRNMPLPSLFVSHIDDLKLFKVGFHKSIIFDDVDFNHYPRTSQIAIVDFDNPRSIHCRHQVAMIPAKVFKVFTCNEWPLCEDPAVLRRVRRINV